MYRLYVNEELFGEFKDRAAALAEYNRLKDHPATGYISLWDEPDGWRGHRPALPPTLVAFRHGEG